MLRWIDTHCHLDAAEFGDAAALRRVRARAAAAGVAHCVIPAVEPANFAKVRSLAHDGADSYALGIHPLYVKNANEADLAVLEEQLARHMGDQRLVAVGEIGLDFFVPELAVSPLREKQEYFYLEQLKLARKFGLPVILHLRRSADRLLKHLRDVGADRATGASSWQGIAHAFNGSDVQAHEFVKLGFKLGFGGALTYTRAIRLRHLVSTLPLAALVLETDAPDMPPQWLYRTHGERAAGAQQGCNEPAELPAIAAVVAQLRGMPTEELASATTENALAALPRLRKSWH